MNQRILVSTLKYSSDTYRYLQKSCSYKNNKITIICTYISSKNLDKIKNPKDSLKLNKRGAL